jgi:hypothetical protein
VAEKSVQENLKQENRANTDTFIPQGEAHFDGRRRKKPALESERQVYAATASIHGHCETGASSSRFNTTASASRTVEAHAGQLIAEFPTELQSWQR